MSGNELSMNKICGQCFNTDDSRTFTKVIGADKDRDQTLGNKDGWSAKVA